MTREFEYDVALSFARQDKTVAEELANQIAAKNISVFLDEYTGSAPWGNNVLDHLVNLYARKARYCVLLISRHYPLKRWTEAEQTSVRERALRDPQEYILPIPLEDVDVPGVDAGAESLDLRPPNEHSMEHIVNVLQGKLADANEGSGPPPQSHDLRSGNVPSHGEKQDE